MDSVKDQKVRVEKNNKNQILIKKQQIYNIAEVVIKGPEVDIKIRITKEKNKELVRVIEKMKKAECHKLHSACIFTTSGPIFTN